MKKRHDPLQALPGIGPAMAEDLRLLGMAAPADLVGKDPQLLYDRLCEITGVKQDRCVLYVFRCAVWVAEHPDDPDQNRRNWWHWKDTSVP